MQTGGSLMSRTALSLTALLCTVGLPTGLLRAPVAAADRPNVVVLFVDDLGWQDVGAYGGPARTPAIDRLAAEGVLFTDFHAGAAVCSPSRAVVLTGRHHVRAGVYHVISDADHEMHLLERETTLAEVLSAHDYATAHFGKWHLGMPYRGRLKPTPDRHGFDYWFATENNASPSHRNPANFRRNGEALGPIEGYASQIVVDEAIAWLDTARDPARPFFLNIWFHEPHAPIAAPEAVVTQYGASDDPAAIYTGTVDNTDRAIARLMAKLEAMDAAENTIVVYSSDNGSYRTDRDGPLRGQKGSLYEGGHRVPGIISWPVAIPGGRVEPRPAGMVDLLPTICGLLDIDPPADVHLDGSDLTPLLTGRPDQFVRHQPLFWLNPAGQPAMTVRDGPHTLVGFRNFDLPDNRPAMNEILEQVQAILAVDSQADDGGGNLWSQLFNRPFANREVEQLRMRFLALNRFQETVIPALKAGGIGRVELYDLTSDLEQRTNVADQHPDIVARLRQHMDAIYASVLADGPVWVSSD